MYTGTLTIITVLSWAQVGIKHTHPAINTLQNWNKRQTKSQRSLNLIQPSKSRLNPLFSLLHGQQFWDPTQIQNLLDTFSKESNTVSALAMITQPIPAHQQLATYQVPKTTPKSSQSTLQRRWQKADTGSISNSLYTRCPCKSKPHRRYP